jgi:Flp pilus assembly pilin Flp
VGSNNKHTGPSARSTVSSHSKYVSDQPAQELREEVNYMLNSLYGFVTTLLVRAHDEEGQTMAEYGILLGVIALVVVAVAILLGSSISTLFSSISKNL